MLEGHVLKIAFPVSVPPISSRFDRSRGDAESIDGLSVHRVKWVEFKPARFLFFPFSLARILYKLRRDVDLVHVHNFSWFGAFVTLFSKALGLPVITKRWQHEFRMGLRTVVEQ